MTREELLRRAKAEEDRLLAMPSSERESLDWWLKLQNVTSLLDDLQEQFSKDAVDRDGEPVKAEPAVAEAL